METLKEYYKNTIKQELQKKFNFKNPMKIPALRKVIISMGIAEASKDKNSVQDHIHELTALSGQKPIITRSKKAISNFKLRKGQAIGLKVTLRGQRMFDFIERFCNIASPRIRDFRGFNPKADGRGNYSLGLEDQQIFAEVNLDKVKRAQGMNITFVTSAINDEECIELLRLFGLPFKGLEVVVPTYDIGAVGGKAEAKKAAAAQKTEPKKAESKNVEAKKENKKAEGKKAESKSNDMSGSEEKKPKAKKPSKKLEEE